MIDIQISDISFFFLGQISQKILSLISLVACWCDRCGFKAPTTTFPSPLLGWQEKCKTYAELKRLMKTDNQPKITFDNNQVGFTFGILCCSRFIID